MSAAIISGFNHDYRDLYKGLQSHRATTDFRQQVSALERQLSNYAAASSLINIPVAASQTSPLATAFSSLANLSAAVKSPTKQHPPLTSSNSVANCNVASIKSSSSNREHRKLDRSVSEPADRSQSNLRPIPPNSSRYKTELCRPFEENGTCKYGDKCQFAHGINELRTLIRHPKYKTELCRTFHTTGFCPYGPRCHFIHNSEDTKKSFISSLQTNGSSSAMSVSPPKHPSPPPSTKDLDLSSFGLGSPCELSPPSSTCSSGSPTSSIGGFFLDDNHLSYSLPQVPQTAPPIVTNGFFFGPDYNTSTAALTTLPPTTLSPSPEFFSPPQQAFEADEKMINLLVNEMDSMNCHDDDVDVIKTDANNTELTVDVNRNIIRLPIFSRLAHGSSP